MNNQEQYEASDPSHSVWVFASAGTGKTKILTDRVLRLLLKNIEPEKILCLTFTNVAASEMQNRIYSKLKKWQNIESKEILAEEIRLLTNKPADIFEINLASSLYNKLLAQKINIYTIHSFCEKILKIFPLEAKINAAFKILDEIKLQEVLNYITNKLYDLLDKESVKFFFTNFHETKINKIYQEILQKKLHFKNYFEAIKAVSPQEINELIQKIDIEIEEKYQKIAKFYSNQADVKKLIITKSGEKTKEQYLKRSLIDKSDHIISEIKLKQNEIYNLVYLKSYYRNKALALLFAEFAQFFLFFYEEYKNNHGLLDFDDLIFFTRELLTNNEARDWVLYKLDGGIEHLLVDEAQDTSALQWEIISALLEEFCSGQQEDKQNKIDKTIFVVGDPKQSIFSFQGADVDSFFSMNNSLQERLKEARKNFKIVNINNSYRSSKEILDLTENTFNFIKNNFNFNFAYQNIALNAARKDKAIVELWPLLSCFEENNTRGNENLSSKKKYFWPLPFEIEEEKKTELLLSEKIAIFIKQHLEEKSFLPSVQRNVMPEDFLILFRTRGSLSDSVNQRLNAHNLPVAGSDRLLLKENLAVLDLISIAKFVVFPFDDLNLSCLLKSPICNLRDDDLLLLTQLQELNKTKLMGKLSLWEIIENDYYKLSQEDDFFISKICEVKQKLFCFLSLYKNTHIGNFFHILVDCLDLRKIFNCSGNSDSENMQNSENQDAINELLYLTMDYAKHHNTSLQSFLYWFENEEIEIKRDINQGGKIRLMTVHGSKGLEAPIVILCDTTSMPESRDSFFWRSDGSLVMGLILEKDEDTPFIKELKEEKKKYEIEEYLRLLYVALTRAADYLVICGHARSSKISLKEYCWFNLVKSAIEKTQKFAENAPENISKEFNSSDKLIEQNNISLQIASEQNIFFSLNSDNYFLRNKKTDYKIVNQSEELEYGLIVHKILEDIIKKNDILIDQALAQKLPTEIYLKLDKTISLLKKQDIFMDLLLNHDQLYKEVNIGGVSGNETIKIGRIDLLVIKDDMALIIDYKSDLNPSRSKEDLPLNYKKQIFFYYDIVKNIFPDKKIKCYILWLEDARLMEII